MQRAIGAYLSIYIYRTRNNRRHWRLNGSVALSGPQLPQAALSSGMILGKFDEASEVRTTR